MLHFKYLRLIVNCCLCLLLEGTVLGQDVHYSQIGNSPQNLNPGLVGVFNGNDRFIGNFRNQWQAVPVPYLQLSAAYNHRFTLENGNATPFAVGFSFNHNKAGDLGLSSTNIGFGGSYSLRLKPAKSHFLSAGVSMGVNQRRFDTAGAILDEQYDFKRGVDLGIPTSENFENSTKWYPTFGFGGNLRLQSDTKRNKLDAGIGIFNFNEPNKSFEKKRPVYHEPRLSVHGKGALELASKLDLLLFGIGQMQGEYREFVFGGGALLYLNQMKTKELALQFGMLYRIDDALIPWVGVHWSAWQFHLSFDLNTSEFNQATDSRGGPEVSVIYIIKNVPAMDYCKLCPKYM